MMHILILYWFLCMSPLCMHYIPYLYSIQYIAGNFGLVLFYLFSLRRAPQNLDSIGYYDDVLRAYNENKTMKIR